jgi:hypothetical protein
MPTPLVWRKAVSGSDRYCKVVLGSPESLARGMFPQGLPRNSRELPISSHTTEERLWHGSGGTCTPRVDRRGHERMAEQSYNPIAPRKVGNRRASRKGAATVPTGGKGEASVRIC